MAHNKVILLGVSYSQPHYIPFFIDIADKFDSLLTNVFADNAAFTGRLSQYCEQLIPEFGKLI